MPETPQPSRACDRDNVRVPRWLSTVLWDSLALALAGAFITAAVMGVYMFLFLKATRELKDNQGTIIKRIDDAEKRIRRAQKDQQKKAGQQQAPEGESP